MFNLLRTRLTIWYISFLAVVIVAVGVAFYLVTVRSLDRDLDDRLTEISKIFISSVNSESDEDNGSDNDAMIQQSIKESQLRDYQIVVAANDGSIIASTLGSGRADLDPTFGGFSEQVIAGNRYRVMGSEFDLGNIRYKLFVLHTLSDLQDLKHRLLAVFTICSFAALSLAALGGYFLVRRNLSPMTEMSLQAREIDSRNLGQRLTIRNKNDEVGRLGMVINDLLARLDEAFEQQRRFMADASHELRTPLAIIRGESEVALSRENRRVDDYRSSLEVVHDETLRLTKIVEDLFTLARADSGQFAAELAPVYLEEIVSDAADSIRVLARERQIAVNLKTEGEMPMNGDEALLRRMLLNLLDNAVKYNHVGGSVTIGCRSHDRINLVTIEDSGIGIPKASHDSIFDRFYRVDKARGHADSSFMGGSGLGLSIAKWIAEIHGGSIKLAASDAKGSKFEVRLPG